MQDVGIGELARQTGLRPSALRYYESLGLLPAARRPPPAARRPPPAARVAAGSGRRPRCAGSP
ncbi:MerR family DNA-binding transcriptional regulator [Kitasatospora purpeofusca]|uniref:MerR family DNA-binding transcriptional regulator n=1 Tax=Kitasatospora purpeofusca TaxID=67352 RepID=UPI00386F6454